MNAKLLPGALLLLLLGGCLSDGPDSSSTTTTSQRPTTTPLGCGPGQCPQDCPFEVCLADREAKYAKVAWEEMRLAQINNDEEPEANPSIDGDWVAWQVDSGVGPRQRYFVIAHELGSDTFIPIQSARNHYRPFMRNETVTFQVSASPSYIARWDSRTNNTERLPIQFQDDLNLRDVQDPWLMIERGGNMTQSGFWIWNMETHRAFKMPGTFQDEVLPDGRVRFVDVGALADGMAVTMVSTRHPDGHFDADIYVGDLETGAIRNLHFPGMTGLKMDAGGHFAGIVTMEEIWLLNLLDGNMTKVSPPGVYGCNRVDVTWPYFSYKCDISKNKPDEYIEIQNLVTGQKVRLDHPEYSIQNVLSDGERFLFEVHRIDARLDTHIEDLYWTTFADQWTRISGA